MIRLLPIKKVEGMVQAKTERILFPPYYINREFLGKSAEICEKSLYD